VPIAADEGANSRRSSAILSSSSLIDGSGVKCETRGVKSRIVAAISNQLDHRAVAIVDVCSKGVQMHNGALLVFVPGGRPIFDGVVSDRDDQVSCGKISSAGGLLI